MVVVVRGGKWERITSINSLNDKSTSSKNSLTEYNEESRVLITLWLKLRVLTEEGKRSNKHSEMLLEKTEIVSQFEHDS